ncbi:LAQU0S02e03532g1_1 [Lachancea quebecensis]|uniref:LAQU0S02e03532g1_1 n=1 Tax=Lachancea quebecensis TaxID=1654605 RepID=A0A0P1KML1_9SACH|nr:LAQU0S02e03532g1_1 [Lachancea quebecensis]
MGINNPIPRSLKSESKKAAKVLASFVKPNQVFGADTVIPPNVLKRAKGLAIITVLKAGFLFSGRAGSGVIVARLRDGSWSAPSAIALAGAGAGGLIGIELTDFVFILNTDDAVKSFSEFGTITLGGNVSVAAGPLGRNAEAAASASLGGVAAVFSYSKTKGIFAGVSVEGSVIIERREANRKIYGEKCKSKMILSGRVRPPPAADPLFRVLESRAFNPNDRARGDDSDEFYDDIPSSFDSSDMDSQRPNTKSSRRRGESIRSSRSYQDSFDDDFGEDDPNDVSGYYSNARNRRTSTRWEDDVYDRDVDDATARMQNAKISDAPSRPRTEKPDFGLSPSTNHRAVSSGAPKAVALYTFKGEQGGDLPFRKGDVITILKKSESQDDWWTGRNNGQEGIFPANYVELV